MRRISLTFAFLAMLPLASAGAQTEIWQRQSWRDSVVTDVVLASILSTLVSDLARGASDTATVGWTFSFPQAAGPIRWGQLESELSRLLRARPVAPSDTLRRSLSVSEARLTADSLVLQFMVTGARRCRGIDDWQGGQTGYLSRMSWAQFTPVPRAQAVLHGDKIGCTAPRAP